MRKLFVGLGFAGLLFWGAAAEATVILDFSTGFAGAGGTITFDGVNASGSGILIDALTVLGTSADGVYDVDGAALTANGVDTAAVLSFDTATGSFTIHGSIPDLGIGDVDLIADGSISSFHFVPNQGLRFVAGSDSKDPGLLEALGIDPDTKFTFFGSSFGFSKNPNEITVISSDILNRPIPEPASLLLLGSGLVALCAVSRRRK